jgi:signal peptidase
LYELTNRPGTGDIPIVHRVIESHTTFVLCPLSGPSVIILINRNTTQLLLTKGDNNPQDDFTLYRGIEYLEREHIIGKVRG